EDDSGTVELVWFRGINWIDAKLKPGVVYVALGKPNRLGTKINIAHPEIEPYTEGHERGRFLHPVYSLTETLRARHFESKALSKLIAQLIELSKAKIRETLTQDILSSNTFLSKSDAIVAIHFPNSTEVLHEAQRRLKFEEFFFIQI